MYETTRDARGGLPGAGGGPVGLYVALRALDAQVELSGHEPRLVAGEWLRAQGLMPKGGVMR